MEYYYSRLAKLGLEDRYTWRISFQQNVVDPQSDDFARAHARTGQQANHRCVDVGAQRTLWPHRRSGIQDSNDLFLRKDIGPSPPRSSEQPTIGDLCLGNAGLQIAEKPSGR